MAGDIIYADLDIPGARLPPSSQPRNCLQTLNWADFRPCPHWHHVVLRIGAAGSVVLLVAVTVLSVRVFQGSSGNELTVSESPRNESKCVAIQETLSRLKRHLCSSAEGSSCVLCPRDWLPYKRKCYWVSKEMKMWKSSQADCITKSSHLLVTQDQEEMDYIQTMINEQNSIWIGLNLKSPERSWSWVDGSLVNEDLHGVRDCGVLKRNQIALDTCSAELKWICQKDALLI
ncbi:killer cell lectin-like receptor subfamily B member 1B allele C [Pelodiscus sinensis]|uniref:killer cell lectin-like receptor subfamily B member 1B allele C n=1 Tax=Pelodiscus sinensis TaxID=13735 RepID=UPI003F6ADA33